MKMNINIWIQIHLTFKKKSGIFYSRILAAIIVIYLSFVILNGKLLKDVAVISEPFQ